MRTVSTAFRTVMCAAVLVVSLGACGAGAPAPAQVEDSPDAGLSVQDWSDGPLRRFTSGIVGAGDWFGSPAGCQGVELLVDQARGEAEPADADVRQSWGEALAALSDVVDACLAGDNDTALSSLDDYTAALERTMSRVNDAD